MLCNEPGRYHTEITALGRGGPCHLRRGNYHTISSRERSLSRRVTVLWIIKMCKTMKGECQTCFWKKTKLCFASLRPRFSPSPPLAESPIINVTHVVIRDFAAPDIPGPLQLMIPGFNAVLTHPTECRWKDPRCIGQVCLKWRPQTCWSAYLRIPC
jgi:hypothetical protein